MASSLSNRGSALSNRVRRSKETTTGGVAGSADGRKYGVVPTATANGVLTNFTLPDIFIYSIDKVGVPAVYLNGVRQADGATCDYTVSEFVATAGYDTIVFNDAPKVGDSIVVDYTPVV